MDSCALNDLRPLSPSLPPTAATPVDEKRAAEERENDQLIQKIAALSLNATGEKTNLAAIPFSNSPPPVAFTASKEKNFFDLLTGKIDLFLKKSFERGLAHFSHFSIKEISLLIFLQIYHQRKESGRAPIKLVDSDSNFYSLMMKALEGEQAYREFQDYMKLFLAPPRQSTAKNQKKEGQKGKGSHNAEELAHLAASLDTVNYTLRWIELSQKYQFELTLEEKAPYPRSFLQKLIYSTFDELSTWLSNILIFNATELSKIGAAQFVKLYKNKKHHLFFKIDLAVKEKHELFRFAYRQLRKLEKVNRQDHPSLIWKNICLLKSGINEVQARRPMMAEVDARIDALLEKIRQEFSPKNYVFCKMGVAQCSNFFNDVEKVLENLFSALSSIYLKLGKEGDSEINPIKLEAKGALSLADWDMTQRLKKFRKVKEKGSDNSAKKKKPSSVPIVAHKVLQQKKGKDLSLAHITQSLSEDRAMKKSAESCSPVAPVAPVASVSEESPSFSAKINKAFHYKLVKQLCFSELAHFSQEAIFNGDSAFHLYHFERARELFYHVRDKESPQSEIKSLAASMVYYLGLANEQLLTPLYLENYPQGEVTHNLVLMSQAVERACKKPLSLIADLNRASIAFRYPHNHFRLLEILRQKIPLGLTLMLSEESKGDAADKDFASQIQAISQQGLKHFVRCLQEKKSLKASQVKEIKGLRLWLEKQEESQSAWMQMPTPKLGKPLEAKSELDLSSVIGRLSELDELEKLLPSLDHAFPFKEEIEDLFKSIDKHIAGLKEMTQLLQKYPYQRFYSLYLHAITLRGQYAIENILSAISLSKGYQLRSHSFTKYDELYQLTSSLSFSSLQAWKYCNVSKGSDYPFWNLYQKGKNSAPFFQDLWRSYILSNEAVESGEGFVPKGLSANVLDEQLADIGNLAAQLTSLLKELLPKLQQAFEKTVENSVGNSVG